MKFPDRDKSTESKRKFHFVDGEPWNTIFWLQNTNCRKGY